MAKPKPRPAKPDRLSVALTGQGGTLLLRGGRVVNVFSGEVHDADVLVLNDEIISVGEAYARADQVIDCAGRTILPGFIEGHIHVESSLLHPAEFARLAAGRGTTALVCDPHEIVNVLGAAGFEFMLKATADLPVDVFFMLPSCVPPTAMESSGGCFGAKEIAKYLPNPRVLGLAEFMDFPGVISGAADVRAKFELAAKSGKLIDGHAPGLRGSPLMTYVAAGVSSDHESATREEGRDKLRVGMRLMIREGSAARNLAGLLPVVNAASSRRCFFVTDDILPSRLLHEGHLDATLSRAVALGLDSITAVQMATLNPAEYFGLSRRGAVAPGFRADLVLVENLEQFRVTDVIKDGVHVVAQGKLISRGKPLQDKRVLKTMHPAAFTARDFAVPAQDGNIKVIRLVPDQIVTFTWIAEPKVEKKLVVADLERDILKLAVIERHKRTGNIGLGFVAGFGMKKGALASSVAHDSHNIIVVGTNDKDMYVAARRLETIGGGFAAAARGKVVAELPLPIAGLMSTDAAENVVGKLDNLLKVARNWGVRLHDPFATLSFLALPVTPELKLTDKGLIDVNRFKVVSLWGED